MKGKTAGLRGVRWPHDGIKLPDFNARPYWAADMREAFVAGFEHCESVGRGYTSAKLNAEALRLYPDKEEK
jgi:hypothetical protein